MRDSDAESSVYRFAGLISIVMIHVAASLACARTQAI
jgi:hypothetical protein